LPNSDHLFGSSSDDGHDDDIVGDDDSETHTLCPHFHSKCGGCKCSSSFDVSTVGDAIFGGNDKGDGDSGDEDNDGNDDMDIGSQDTFSLSSSSGDSSSSASNPVQPSSNRNAFACRDDADVMLLSCTNNSLQLQQHISSSDFSSLIGPCQNPDHNAHAKAHSYEVCDDSSDFGTDCTSSDKSAMVDASDSSFPIPNSFKPSPRSSFEVSNVPLSKGQAMIGPVGNLHLGSPERGDISRRGNTAKRIGTQSSTMAVKALRLLQPAKGANEGDGDGSGHFVRHKKAQR
jgi:hypothetical protein